MLRWWGHDELFAEGGPCRSQKCVLGVIDSFGSRGVYEKMSGNVCIEVQMQRCDEVRLKLSTMTAPTISGNGQTSPSSGPLLQGRGILGVIHLLSPDPEPQANCQNTNPNDKSAHAQVDSDTTTPTCKANTRMVKPTSGRKLAHYQIPGSGSWPACIGLRSRAQCRVKHLLQ